MKFRIKDIYGLFYVMTEGIESDGSNRWAAMFGVISLFLDVAQVIHVMVSTNLGWSASSANLAQWLDVMYIFKSQAQRVIPQYLFYSLGMLLVSVAMADTIYVIKLFSSGHVDQLWPVKLLSFLVAAIVTTAFSSIFNWLLHPIECLAYPTAVIFSTYVNGPDAPCTPFNYPEIMITIPTLIFAALFMVFALTTSLLTFSLNPLSTQIRAQCNGRVENLWLSFEMAVSISVYIANYTTYLAANFVLLLWITFVMYHHLSIFPFHRHLINVLRGGIFMMVAWLLGMSCVFGLAQYAASLKPTDLPIDSASQFLQWVALACLPLAFLLGSALVHHGRERLYATLDALHHEVEQHKIILDSGGVMCAEVGKQQPRGDELHLEQIMPEITAVKQPVRSEWIKFFKSNLEKHKTFASSMHANACARALLYRRDEKSLKFLNLVIRRGLEEHPYSVGLYMLQIRLLRFVHRSPMNASMQEKMIQAGCKKLGITDGYILYALMRKASQEKAGTSIGQDDLKAIDLMEYDAGMKKGEKLQMRCIAAMKNFWKVAARRQFKPHNVGSMLNSLREWDDAISMAQKEYAWLLKKYKNSSTLLMSYARFCDYILNDEKLASLKREAAHRAEKSEAAITADTEQHHSENDVVEDKERSVREGSVASEAESRRTMASRYIANMTPLILGREIAVVQRLHLQIKVLIFILLLLGTIAFVFVAYFIFNDIAVQDISGITVTAQFRVMAVMCAYLQRSQMIAATLGDVDEVSRLAQQTLNITIAIENTNWNMYHNIDTSEIRDHMHNTKYEVQLPVAPSFVPRNSTYFNLVNEFTRRVAQAALLPVSELRDPNFNMTTMVDGKRNVVYTQENLFRTYVPMFEGIVAKYEREVSKFGTVAMQLVATICAIIALNVAIMAVCVIRALANHIQTLQHKFVCCCVALTLPMGAAQTIFKHFRTLENQIKDGDEDERETNMEDVTNMLENQGVSSPFEGVGGASTNSPKDDHDALMEINTRMNSGLQVEAIRSARMSDEANNNNDSNDPLLMGQSLDEWHNQSRCNSQNSSFRVGARASPPKQRGMEQHMANPGAIQLNAFRTGSFQINTNSAHGGGSFQLTEKTLQQHIALSGGYNETEGGIILLNHKKAGASGSMSSNHSTLKSPVSSLDSSLLNNPILQRTASAQSLSRQDSLTLGRNRSSNSLTNSRKNPAGLLSPKVTQDGAEVSASLVSLKTSGDSHIPGKGAQAFRNSRGMIHAVAALQKRQLKSAMKSSPMIQASRRKASPESLAAKRRQVLIMGKDGNVTPSRGASTEFVEVESPGQSSDDLIRRVSSGSDVGSGELGRRSRQRSPGFSGDSTEGGSRDTSPNMAMPRKVGKLTTLLDGVTAKVTSPDLAPKMLSSLLEGVTAKATSPDLGPARIKKGAKEEVQRLRDLLKNVSPAKVDKKDSWRDRWTAEADEEGDKGAVIDGGQAEDEAPAVAAPAEDGEEGLVSPIVRPSRASRKSSPGEDVKPESASKKSRMQEVEDLTVGSPLALNELPVNDDHWPGEGPSPRVGADSPSIEAALEDDACKLDDNDWVCSPEIGPIEPLKRRQSARKLTPPELTRGSSLKDMVSPGGLKRLGSNMLLLAGSSKDSNPGRTGGLQEKANGLMKSLSRTASFKNLVDKGLDRATSINKNKKPSGISDTGARTIADETRTTMARAIRNSQSMYSSTGLYCFVLTSIMFLSVFCFVFPAIKMMDLINMASTLSQASRRSFLVESIVHLTREMVLNDGFSRLTNPQAAYAIQNYIEQLRVADEAVRVGGKLEINSGADEHNIFHNKYMYQKGCPWRDNSTDCTVMGMPGVGGSGYYQLFTAFIDAVAVLLTKYGPGPTDRLGEGADWMGPSGDSQSYTTINLPVEKLPLFQVQNDRYLNFSQQAFDGDVNKGLSDVVDLLRDETLRILNSALNFNKYLYSVHVIVVFVVFYWFLFRRTIHLAIQEVHHARNFVVRMPVHILPQRDVELLVDYFRNPEDAENQEDDDIVDIEKKELPPPDLQSRRSSGSVRKSSLTSDRSLA